MLGRLVEHEDGKLCQQGTSDHHPLALASRRTGALTADLGGETGRQFVEPTCQPDPGAAVRRSASVALRRPMRRFSAREVSNGIRVPGRRVRRRCGRRHLQAGPDPCRRFGPHLPRKQGNEAAPPQPSSLPAPLGPTTATRRPLLSSRSIPRSAGTDGGTEPRHRGRRAHKAEVGLTTAPPGRSPVPAHRSRRTPEPPSAGSVAAPAWPPGGQPPTQGGHRNKCDHRQQDPVEPAGANKQGFPRRQRPRSPPGEQRRESEPYATRPGRHGGGGRELAVDARGSSVPGRRRHRRRRARGHLRRDRSPMQPVLRAGRLA